MKTVVIIPTYNERENVQEVISQVLSHMPHAKILIVDDNSPDGTRDIVRGLQAKDTRIDMLERSGKEGLGKAYMHAFSHVLGNYSPDALVMMDADLSHDPSYLPHKEKMLNEADVIVGSRYVPGGDTVGWEPWRKALSKYGNVYARTITGIPVRDLTAGFYTIKAEALRRVNFEQIDSSGYAFQIELKHQLWRTGARFKEVPIVFRNRVGGESKISNHIIREGVLAPWKIRFKK